MVKKQTSDWTKDIIGPMTIMNPNELKELNKILKANSRMHRSVSEINTPSAGRAKPDKSRALSLASGPFKPALAKKSTQPKFEMNILEEEEEEEEKEEENDEVFVETKKYTDEELPLVVIEHPSVVENEEDEEEVVIDKGKLSSQNLASPSPELKKKIARAKNKVLDKKKDMPEWARKFLEEQENVKVADSASIKSPEGAPTEDPLGSLAIPMTSQSPPVSLEVPGMCHSPPVSHGAKAVQNDYDKSLTDEGAKHNEAREPDTVTCSAVEVTNAPIAKESEDTPAKMDTLKV